MLRFQYPPKPQIGNCGSMISVIGGRNASNRIGFDDANYRRPELAWTQRNFVCAQMMIEERDFFDREKFIYTVDRYLDRLQNEFGALPSSLRKMHLLQNRLKARIGVQRLQK